MVIPACLCSFSPFWGFYAHKKINRMAVFSLPPEMILFYREHIDYLSATAVNPDKRRYVVDAEAARHYLDLDYYADTVELPRYWGEATKMFSEDTLRAHGVLPWHLYTMYFRLREAFMVRDPDAILRLSSDLGHYVGDAHVPLHTTRNYNGQLTGQVGIHGFWESRLPELFSEEYDYLVGRSVYLDDPQATAWRIVEDSHALVNEVLWRERELSDRFGEKKFSFETRGRTTVKVYAREFSRAYHRRIRGMVEARMRAAILMTASFWYTAWVDAGQPELSSLLEHTPTEEELEQRRAAVRVMRSHE